VLGDPRSQSMLNQVNEARLRGQGALTLAPLPRF
jgi:hypothetical protein